MLTSDGCFKTCDIKLFLAICHISVLRRVCQCVFELRLCTHNQAYGMLVNTIVRCVAYICGNTSVCRFGTAQGCCLLTRHCVKWWIAVAILLRFSLGDTYGKTFGEVFLRAFSTETFYRPTRGGTGATFSICKSKVINQLAWVHKASSSPKTDLFKKTRCTQDCSPTCTGNLLKLASNDG